MELKARHKEQREVFQSKVEESGRVTPELKYEGQGLLAKQRREQEDFFPKETTSYEKSQIGPTQHYNPQQTEKKVQETSLQQNMASPEKGFTRQGQAADKDVATELKAQTELLKQIANREGLS